MVHTPAELSAAFRGRGLRITPQRVAVFEALQHSTDHPSVESIHRTVASDIRSVSLRTVYQTLSDLTDMGEISRLEFGVDAARFDPNTDDHHHLMCDECGRITDVYLDVSVLDLAHVEGFQPIATKVFISGRCEHCAAADANATDHDRSDSNPTNTTARSKR